jgi:hypothetical protein
LCVYLLVSLQDLKFAAFPKLFRSQVDPDLVTAVLASVASLGDSVPAASADAKTFSDTIHKFVGALTRTPSFDMTTMMFTPSEKQGGLLGPHSVGIFSQRLAVVMLLFAVIGKIVEFVRSSVGDAQANDVRKWLA